MKNIDELAKKIYEKLHEERLSAGVFSEDDFDIAVEIRWGDWKHEHLRCKLIVEELLKENGYETFHTEQMTESDGSDCYSAIHRFVPIG